MKVLKGGGGIAPTWGSAKPTEKVSGDMGYRSDGLAISRDVGPLSTLEALEESRGEARLQGREFGFTRHFQHDAECSESCRDKLSNSTPLKRNATFSAFPRGMSWVNTTRLDSI